MISETSGNINYITTPNTNSWQPVTTDYINTDYVVIEDTEDWNKNVDKGIYDFNEFNNRNSGWFNIINDNDNDIELTKIIEKIINEGTTIGPISIGKLMKRVKEIFKIKNMWKFEIKKQEEVKEKKMYLEDKLFEI